MSDNTTSETSPKFVITLVHGTWSSARNWPAASRIRSEIEQSLTNSRIESFPWSGHNNNIHRIEAQSRLVIQLQSQLEKYPAAKHFIIAHSHGTQVSLYALRNPNIVGKIAGVVGLGSPFLIASARNTESFRDTFWGWFELRVWVFLVGLISVSIFGEQPIFTIITLAAFAVFLFVPSLTQRLKQSCYRCLISWIRETQRRTKAAMGFVPGESTPVFFIAAREDEAYWLLKVEGFILQTLAGTYVVSTKLVNLAAIIWLTGLLLSFLLMFFTGFAEAIFGFSMQILIWLPIAVIILFFVELLFVPLMRALAANGIAFGWDKISTYLWSRVLVFRKPKHCIDLKYQDVKLKPNRFGRLHRGIVGQLSHCAYYEDSGCVDAIVKWVIATADRNPQSIAG
jgi:pimeloyl-ACP methyl ester carboxylesterase